MVRSWMADFDCMFVNEALNVFYVHIIRFSLKNRERNHSRNSFTVAANQFSSAFPFSLYV